MELTLTEYWYLVKINPQANEKKFYSVYVMVETVSGMYHVGSHYGRIGMEQTGGGSFRSLSSNLSGALAFVEAETLVKSKLAKGYSTGTVTVKSVWVEGPNERLQLAIPTGQTKVAAVPPVTPDVAANSPTLLQDLWLATEVDGNAFVSYSLLHGDGWLIPYRRESVLKEGVPKLMFNASKNERGIAQARCVVSHPGGGLVPSVTAISAVLIYEPGEKNLHLCSFDQLRSL